MQNSLVNHHSHSNSFDSPKIFEYKFWHQLQLLSNFLDSQVEASRLLKRSVCAAKLHFEVSKGTRRLLELWSLMTVSSE